MTCFPKKHAPYNRVRDAEEIPEAVAVRSITSWHEAYVFPSALAVMLVTHRGGARPGTCSASQMKTR
jgi:hypothetical protein